jgi:hypothetical protein
VTARSAGFGISALDVVDELAFFERLGRGRASAGRPVYRLASRR